MDWTGDIGLFEALHIGDLVDYSVEPDAWDKRDYILGLAGHLIKNPYHTLASADVIHRFKLRANAHLKWTREW